MKERVIRFGHLNNPDHPVSIGVKKFAELVAAKSGGKLQIKEFPSNQLGTEQQQTSALQGGVQEMQAPATTSLVGIVKDYGVVDFPFTVSNHAQAFALLDGPLGKTLFEKLPEKGLIGLAYWDLGFRNVTNSKHPIEKFGCTACHGGSRREAGEDLREVEPVEEAANLREHRGGLRENVPERPDDRGPLDLRREFRNGSVHQVQRDEPGGDQDRAGIR